LNPKGWPLPWSNDGQGYDEGGWQSTTGASRAIYLDVLMLSPLTYAATCATDQSKDENALIQIEHTWARALEQHNREVFQCVLADEFEDAGTDGKLTDRAATLAKVANHNSVHHALAELHARVYGDFGYIRGMATALDPRTKLVLKVRFTDVYVYRDRWQCVAGHESLISALSQ
jgi:hypothetical protein